MRPHLVPALGLVLTLVGCGDPGQATDCTTMDAPSGVVDTVSGTPAYGVDEPNGEGCGERKKATLDL